MKKLLGLVLAAMLLLSTVPAAIAEEPEQTAVQTETRSTEQKGTIVNCKTAVNVREKATKNSKLLGKAKKGETFPVLGRSGNWVKIRFSDSVDGYVFKRYIRVTGEGSTTYDGRTATIVNCKVAANVRAKASSKSKLLGTAAKGEVYNVLGISGSWVKIDYDNGTAGFVFKRYVKLEGSEEESIDGKTGTIRCNTHVNIRERATKYSKLLGTAKNGETFTVRGRSGNWIKIDYKGKTGYVYKSYIRIG